MSQIWNWVWSIWLPASLITTALVCLLANRLKGGGK